MKNSWQQVRINFNSLRGSASRLNSGYTSALRFLVGIGIVPEGARVESPAYINTNLDPDSIPAGYLAALAYEWDKDGPSTPLDFVDSLRPEIKGSAARDIVRDALEEASRERFYAP